MFIASLLGVVATMIHVLSIGGNFNTGELIGIMLMPLVLAVFLVWYSKYAGNRGWVYR